MSILFVPTIPANHVSMLLHLRADTVFGHLTRQYICRLNSESMAYISLVQLPGTDFLQTYFIYITDSMFNKRLKTVSNDHTFG